MKRSSVKPAGKPFSGKKNPLSPWALDKGVRWFITTVKRNIVRVRRCVVYVVHGTFGY